jgi:hypothetical protein
MDEMGLSYQNGAETVFKINDGVRILLGELIGETGSVVSVIARNPQPMYLVETCCGRDVMVPESDLQLIDLTSYERNGADLSGDH